MPGKVLEKRKTGKCPGKILEIFENSYEIITEYFFLSSAQPCQETVTFTEDVKM